MKLEYEELNEMYNILVAFSALEDEPLLDKMGHAINLIDECEMYGEDSQATIKQDDRVLVTFYYDPCWPYYLINEIENGDVTIDSAYKDFVTVEL